MYEITINVNNDGSLQFTDSILKLGTYLEVGRTKFLFCFEEGIEGTYRYVKFAHNKATFLKRISSSQTLVIPKEVLMYSGQWLMCVVSSYSAITNNLSSEYLYISETREAVVMESIISNSITSSDDLVIKGLIEGQLSELDIPIITTQIGKYFLYMYQEHIRVKVPNSVRWIGINAFRGSLLYEIEFEENSSLILIDEYAFNETVLLKSIKIPRSVTAYGKYVLSLSGVTTLIFEDNSSIEYFNAYSFYKLKITELSIPKNVKGFDSSGQVISYCDNLQTVSLPNTFRKAVQSYHFKNNGNLSEIILEEGWDCDINVSNINLTKSSIEKMVKALKDLTYETETKVIALGSSNLQKCDSSVIEEIERKSWSYS